MRSRSAKSLTLFSVLLTGTVCASLSTAAQASEPEWILLTYTDVTVKQVSSQSVKTTGKAVMLMNNRGQTVKARISLNPSGTVASTGKTRTQNVVLKWDKKLKEYSGKFTFVTKASGPLVVKASAAGRHFTTTKRMPKQQTKITGLPKGATYIKSTQQAGAYITVSPAYGRKVYVERKVNNKWVRERTLTTSKTAESDRLRLLFPAPTERPLETYRVYSPATKQAAKSRVLVHSIGLKDVSSLEQ